VLATAGSGLPRYHGQFYEGQRSGYGVLYYATGARYEGHWVKDKKEGEGCYVFENGEVRRTPWQGAKGKGSWISIEDLYGLPFFWWRHVALAKLPHRRKH